MHKIKLFFVAFWPSLIVLAVILYATLASHPVGVDELPPIPHLDKVIHAVMMGGMLAAIIFDISRYRHRLPSKKTMWILCLCVCALGLAIEGIQAIPIIGRGCDPADFAADCIGALAALWLAPPAISRALHMR